MNTKSYKDIDQKYDDDRFNDRKERRSFRDRDRYDDYNGRKNKKWKRNTRPDKWN